MEIRFKTYGHENVLCKHKKTIEFTKDTDLTLNGDCIIGVNSDFSYQKIKHALKWKKARLSMVVDDKKECVEGYINKDFSSKDEIVLRKSDFISPRTLLINCDKACMDLRKDIIDKMSSKDTKMKVILEKI